MNNKNVLIYPYDSDYEIFLKYSAVENSFKFSFLIYGYEIRNHNYNDFFIHNLSKEVIENTDYIYITESAEKLSTDMIFSVLKNFINKKVIVSNKYYGKPDIIEFCENNHIKVTEVDELKKFLDTAKNDFDLKKYTLFRLLAFSGMRIGECLALTWHDLDYKNNTIAINKTLARTKNGIKIQTPKTKSSNRVISLDTETMQVLKMWQFEQRKQLLKLGINSMNKQQLIFSNTKNKFIIIPTVRLAIKQIAKKAGIYPITTHGFRHTHATLLFASGMDIKQVQARLGHSNVQTTLNIYTHAIQDKQDKIGDEFAKYINF